MVSEARLGKWPAAAVITALIVLILSPVSTRAATVEECLASTGLAIEGFVNSGAYTAFGSKPPLGGAPLLGAS